MSGPRFDYRRKAPEPPKVDDGLLDLRPEHLNLLSRVLDLNGLYGNAREAFEEMLEEMTTEKSKTRFSDPVTYKRMALSEKQEAWVRRCLGEEVVQPDTRFTAGSIPRGRPVPTPEVLKNLPKFPPGRRPT